MTDAAWRESCRASATTLRNQRATRSSPTSCSTNARPEIETPDQLYEYFLVDVQMDACMQTSRIRLALSTVQLFITRCLMNLEHEVSVARSAPTTGSG